MGEKNGKEDFGEPVKSLPESNGKPDFRDNHGCCRDFYCLIVFAACVIAVIVIFAVGFSQGTPYKLYCPLNSLGEYCGHKNDDQGKRDLTNYPYLFRPNTTDATIEICVSECPIDGKRCIHSDGTLGQESEADCIAIGDAIYANYTTMNLVQRCFPDIIDEAAQFDSYESFKNVFTTSVSDFKKGWWVLLISAGCAIILSFIWICFMQCCGKCLVWTSIILCLILILLLGLWMLIYGLTNYMKLPSEQDKTNCYVLIGFGGAVLLIWIILVIIMIALRKRISLAVGLVQEASKALRSMCCLIVVPLGYILLFAVVVVFLIVTMVFYFSSLNFVENGGHKTIEPTSNTRWVVLFVFLMFLWCTFFIMGMNTSTIAGAGAEWYFTRDKATDLPTFPIGRSLKILVLHHMGSVSVGSFLIAVVALFRTIVLYLQQKVKEKAPENCCLRCCLACLQCCLGCCQRFLEFIADRAYVMMMIFGKSFFPSAIDAMNLMLRNILRTAVLTKVTSIIIICGVLAVTALSSLICLIILRPDFIVTEKPFLEIVYWWFILLICAIIAFAVAWLMMMVYDSLIQTLFMCFLIDEEMHLNSQGAHEPYASISLQQQMDTVKNRSKEMKEAQTNTKKGQQKVIVEVDYDNNEMIAM
ncbi:putative Choline Transporter-like (CTL) Family Protein [Monocercomonoides exilis]|uniref:putative Choline Transporter-like (CTL) Family Protein n=1 Tax=Monocercomonoides exilis TaxID=2049356 RepID=UPI003559AF59|nr:putative Choline Transporter-like (CTL) Family Protein [Monocercomonoides exilis]|eukprot:MONOS_15772.1-p1 / transcript=MONOS_15772.1 / gene=MONOS_15772 / organism=Monocercomonoides_exilis_PA203 / gene_product=Choline Transporter-like (CTL) Family Protein / transcript_product=Choline Transporter-like (CTL) Family Protein / location=Mono_scaffold01351:724-2782(-) / protein_length=642 / sequence_SO=supercontig / SO=protein_coding / is_pseudo=false